MRLIDTDKLKFPNIAVFDMKLHGAMVPMVRVLDLKELMPAVDAVPLDKLCEWMNVHCGRPNYCNGRLCGECNLDGEGFEYETCWKILLTEWMEEQQNE